MPGPDANDRLQDWLSARVHAMALVRSWGFAVDGRDWPPVWDVRIPLSDDEARGRQVLAYLDLGPACDGDAAA